MKLAHNIGTTDVEIAKANYNTREEIEACEDRISFDGVYENVWKNRDILKGRRCLMFVMGNYIGKDNRFDHGMPREKYCTREHLQDLVDDGHILAWHTWSHPDLTKVSLEMAESEMKPAFRCLDFAYPYGRFNEDLKQIAQGLGYERAWSVTQGNKDPYSLRRDYI